MEGQWGAAGGPRGRAQMAITELPSRVICSWMRPQATQSGGAEGGRKTLILGNHDYGKTFLDQRQDL